MAGYCQQVRLSLTHSEFPCGGSGKHTEILALLNSSLGFVAPPRGEDSTGPKCIFVLTETKPEHCLYRLTINSSALKSSF